MGGETMRRETSPGSGCRKARKKRQVIESWIAPLAHQLLAQLRETT